MTNIKALAEKAVEDDLVKRLHKRISLLREIGEERIADDLKEAVARITALDGDKKA